MGAERGDGERFVHIGLWWPAHGEHGGCGAKTGPLTDWHEQERLLWTYYKQPLDAWSVSISEVLRMDDEGLELNARFSSKKRCGQHSRPNIMPPLCVPTIPMVPQSVGARAVLEQEWRIDLQRHPFVLLIPQPIMALVLAGKWFRLLVCRSWVEMIGARILCDQFRCQQSQRFRGFSNTAVFIATRHMVPLPSSHWMRLGPCANMSPKPVPPTQQSPVRAWMLTQKANCSWSARSQL